MALNVTVNAPDQETWTGQAEKVVITSTSGQLGILPGHAAMVTTVDVGMLLIEKTENEWLPMISFSGIAVVNNDYVQILLSSYESTLEINEETADEQLKQALNALSDSQNDETANKVFLSQNVKAASSRLFATQIINKKRIPFS
jgi:F-type H+-transporting ATPase subunit epsilon